MRASSQETPSRESGFLWSVPSPIALKPCGHGSTFPFTLPKLRCTRLLRLAGFVGEKDNIKVIEGGS